jgi:cytochrome c biogenesis protein CcdA
VFGLSTVFIALGASASVIGGLIRAWSAQLSILAGIVIIVMGLHFLGLTRIAFLMREGRLPIPKPVGLGIPLASVERAMGVLMVLTGVGFLTGSVSSISIWLLETFPALQNFG